MLAASIHYVELLGTNVIKNIASIETHHMTVCST